MKLINYGTLEYFFYSQNQQKLHIRTWWQENNGFGLCGADIGFDEGDDDIEIPVELYDVIGAEFPDEKICKNCLKIYRKFKGIETPHTLLPLGSE